MRRSVCKYLNVILANLSLRLFYSFGATTHLMMKFVHLNFVAKVFFWLQLCFDNVGGQSLLQFQQIHQLQQLQLPTDNNTRVIWSSPEYFRPILSCLVPSCSSCWRDSQPLTSTRCRPLRRPRHPQPHPDSSGPSCGSHSFRITLLYDLPSSQPYHSEFRLPSKLSSWWSKISPQRHDTCSIYRPSVAIPIDEQSFVYSVIHLRQSFQWALGLERDAWMGFRYCSLLLLDRGVNIIGRGWIYQGLSS